jgi:hypothetical protein
MNIYQVVSWGQSVGIGVSGTRHLHLAGYGKRAEAQQPYLLVNELIAAEMGHFLRIPVPPACIVADSDGRHYFASLSFALTGAALPPIIPDNFYGTFPSGSADLLVFDIFIANYDRHPGNLAAEYGNPARFNVFDHSHCLLNGSAPTGGEVRLQAAQNALVIDGRGFGSRHCLIDKITDDGLFLPILQRLESIPSWFVESVVEGASGYGLTPAETTALTTFLLNRRNSVRELIRANHNAFPSIAQWRSL